MNDEIKVVDIDKFTLPEKTEDLPVFINDEDLEMFKELNEHNKMNDINLENKIKKHSDK